MINGKMVWTGYLDEHGGHIVLGCDEHSWLDVGSFRVVQ